MSLQRLQAIELSGFDMEKSSGISFDIEKSSRMLLDC